MSQPTGCPTTVKNNIVRARVTVRGTRPLLQHAFGPDSIPLEDQEKTGKAGNDPEEWRRSCMVTPDGQLFIRGSYVFGCVRNGAKHTKKGRGSYQPLVAATLQVEDETVLLNRRMPKEGDPPMNTRGPTGTEVYIDVAGVRNPSTKGRNIRYRLAASAGWECAFTLRWDKTVVPREIMRAILIDAGTLAGLADGVSVGYGKFEVIAYEELTDAEEASAEGGVEAAPADRVDKRRKGMRPLQGVATDNGGAH